MNGALVIGLVMLAVGIVLLIFGYNASQSVGEQILEGVTGEYSDRTMGYIIAGVALVVAGVALVVIAGRRKRA